MPKKSDNSKECFWFTIMILAIISLIYFISFFDIYNDFNSYTPKKCKIDKVDYPTSIDINTFWGKCRCGKTI